MTTTRPQPRSIMPGNTSLVMRALTPTFPAKAASNSSGPVSAQPVPARVPRLLTRMSIGPSLAVVSSTARRQPSAFSRSAATPIPPSELAVRATSDSVRAAIATRAPSALSAWAIPRPAGPGDAALGGIAGRRSRACLRPAGDVRTLGHALRLEPALRRALLLRTPSGRSDGDAPGGRGRGLDVDLARAGFG